MATVAGRPYSELDSPFHELGAVLEATSFHPGHRARDHLRVLAAAAGLPDDRVDGALEQVGLRDVADRRVKGFSLGMRQRLGLAAALLGEPKVLILDEPANGLDPEGVHWLRQFLRAYADHGGTVLVSSHLLAEVAQTVDDVVIIAAGRLIRQSSLRELAHEAAPGVCVRTPQADALRDTLIAEGIATETTSLDTVVALDTTTEHVGQLASAAGIVIYEMTVQHFDLEQYFLALTDPTGMVRCTT
jgi:ABC-2 type transport system ATP-binding protein